MAAAGHANVQGGYVGNESLNLIMGPVTVRDGWKYASVEKFGYCRGIDSNDPCEESGLARRG